MKFKADLHTTSEINVAAAIVRNGDHGWNFQPAYRTKQSKPGETVEDVPAKATKEINGGTFTIRFNGKMPEILTYEGEETSEFRNSFNGNFDGFDVGGWNNELEIFFVYSTSNHTEKVIK